MPIDLLAADRLLAGPGAHDLLAAYAGRTGELLRARLRSVHHHGGRSLTRVFDATLQERGAVREVLIVVHVGVQALPAAATVLEVEGLPVAVWSFPEDPFLPGLRSAVDPGRVQLWLEVLGAQVESVHLRVRAYRPTRRAVVEVTADAGERSPRRVFLKVLVPHRAAALADIHQQLAPHLPVPQVLGLDPDGGIVTLEALDGSRLRDAVVGGAALPDPWELVCLTDRLAACPLDTGQEPRRFADATRHVPLLSRLLPGDAKRVERLAAHTRSLHGPLVTVHGDLHDGQLLLDGATVSGVLDVDGAGAGLVAEDAGRLVAYLRVLVDREPEQAARITAYADAVAGAFARSVGAEELARGTAAAWLGLATGAYRSQAAGWLAITRQRIDQAERALQLG